MVNKAANVAENKTMVNMDANEKDDSKKAPCEKGDHFAHLVLYDNFDPAASPREPGRARTSDSGQARSKPFPHAPVFRMALVGKAQLPQTTYLHDNIHFSMKKGVC